MSVRGHGSQVLPNAVMSNLTPVPTKKNGWNQPKDDRIEFVPERLRVSRAGRHSNDHACGKGTEDPLEPELLGEHEQSREHEQSQAHRELRARVHRTGEKGQYLRRACAEADRYGNGDNNQEDQQEARLVPRAVFR